MTELSELLDETDPIGSVFRQLIGLPARNVQKGQGSMLIFKFGAPHGEWCLWIYCCHWRYADGDIDQSTDESTDMAIIAATRSMDGQRLTSVKIDPASGRSIFRFDQGATLDTWPYNAADNDEQWMLYTPSDHVLTFRADEHYSWTAADQSPDEEHWLPLPRTGA